MMNVVVTLTGPSASGKSTMEAALCESPNFGKVISHTTRAPRAGEKHGEEYYFVTDAEYDRLKREGRFVETVAFGGHRYGADRLEFERIFGENKIAVLVCDPNGREAIDRAAPELDYTPMAVYVTNPPTVRYERLVDRFIEQIQHLELGGEAFRARKQAFAERLAAVAGIEAHWGDESWQYDTVIETFDASNGFAVIGRIAARALNLRGTRNESRSRKISWR